MSARAAKIARLRALRAAGKTAFDDYEVQEAEELYDNVDEEAYKKVVRKRLDEDDFVVDDNGAGYADDGREEDFAEYADYSDDEEDGQNGAKGGKRKRELDLEREKRVKNGINKYFAANAPAAAPVKSKV